jgi:hypothetical protein
MTNRRSRLSIRWRTLLGGGPSKARVSWRSALPHFKMKVDENLSHPT